MINQRCASGDKTWTRLTKAACYAVQYWAQYPEGSQLYNASYVSEGDAQALKSELGWIQSMQQEGQFVYSGFDKITDDIAAFTGISNDAIGGKPISDWTKPITDTVHCVTAECAAGLLPTDKFTTPPSKEQLANATDKGSAALGLVAIWSPPPLDIGAELMAGAFKATSYLLNSPTYGQVGYDTASIFIGAYLPQTQWIQTGFAVGADWLQPVVVPALDNSPNSPSCTLPKKC